MIENKDGTSDFVKKTKLCEFCGAELEQVTMKFGEVIKYYPAYQKCKCEQSQIAIEKEKEEKRKELALEKQRQAEQRKINKIKNLFSNSGMSKRAMECSFDDYQITFQNSQAVQICLEYVKDFDVISTTNRNGLFITGDCGVGKSHLAFATANSLIKEGNSVIAMTMIDLLLKIKDSYNAKNLTEEQILNIYEECTLLIIDDLGKEKPTDWVLQMIYSIIDRRYNAKKPIIVTTNYTAPELIRRFGDTSTGKAIVDRLFEICQYVPIGGDSFRKKGD